MIMDTEVCKFPYHLFLVALQCDNCPDIGPGEKLLLLVTRKFSEIQLVWLLAVIVSSVLAPMVGDV